VSAPLWSPVHRPLSLARATLDLAALISTVFWCDGPRSRPQGAVSLVFLLLASPRPRSTMSFRIGSPDDSTARFPPLTCARPPSRRLSAALPPGSSIHSAVPDGWPVHAGSSRPLRSTVAGLGQGLLRSSMTDSRRRRGETLDRAVLVLYRVIVLASPVREVLPLVSRLLDRLARLLPISAAPVFAGSSRLSPAYFRSPRTGDILSRLTPPTRLYCKRHSPSASRRRCARSAYGGGLGYSCLTQHQLTLSYPVDRARS